MTDIKPTEQAIKDSKVFLELIKDYPKPYISHVSDGEVNFYWKIDWTFLDLGFYGDGTYSFYGKRHIKDKNLMGDDIPVNTLDNKVALILSCLRLKENR